MPRCDRETDSGGAAPIVFNRLAWSAGGFVAKATLTLATLVVLARLLTPAEIGLVAVAWIIVDLMASIGQTSVGHILMQRRELRRRDVDAVFTLGLVLGCACTVVLWLAAPAIAAASDTAGLEPLLRALAVAPVVASLGIVPTHMLLRELRQREYIAATLGAYALGYGGAATVLALQGWGAWAPIAGELLRTALFASAVVVLHKGRFPPRLTLRGSTALLRQAAGYMLTQASGIVLRSAPQFLVWRTLGTVALGYFSRAERLALLLNQALHATIFDVTFVATAQRQARRERLRWFYMAAAEGLALAAIPASLVLAMAAPEAVDLVLGGQWGESAPVLQVLALGVPLQAWHTLNAATMRGLGRVYGETARQAAYAGLIVTGAWFGCRYGLVGVAAGVVVAHLLGCLMLIRAATLLGLTWRDLGRCLAATAWTVAWAMPLAWLLLLWLRAVQAPPELAFAATAAAVAGAMLAALRLAPRWAQPGSLQVLAEAVQLEALGAPGRFVQRGLRALTARHVPVRPSPSA